MTPTFIHLRVHTQYSILQGAMKTGKLVKRIKELNMPAVAVTDLGNLYGGFDFSHEAPDAGIQPILGTQLKLKIDPPEGKLQRKNIIGLCRSNLGKDKRYTPSYFRLGRWK